MRGIPGGIVGLIILIIVALSLLGVL